MYIKHFWSRLINLAIPFMRLRVPRLSRGLDAGRKEWYRVLSFSNRELKCNTPNYIQRGFLFFFFYESISLLKAANSYELVHRVASREGLSMEVTRRLPKVIVESDFLMPLNEGSVGWDFGFPHNYRGRTLPWIEKGEKEGRMRTLKGVRVYNPTGKFEESYE